MYQIMSRRCKDCIAPEGFVPSPETADFKRLVDECKASPMEAVWSCTATCTHENLTTHRERIMGCLGSAIFFGAVA
jgi:hypothetical protein